MLILFPDGTPSLSPGEAYPSRTTLERRQVVSKQLQLSVHEAHAAGTHVPHHEWGACPALRMKNPRLGEALGLAQVSQEQTPRLPESEGRRHWPEAEKCWIEKGKVQPQALAPMHCTSSVQSFHLSGPCFLHQQEDANVCLSGANA